MEMMDLLGTDQDWRGVRGIAYRAGAGAVVATELRPLVPDLEMGRTTFDGRLTIRNLREAIEVLGRHSKPDPRHRPTRPTWPSRCARLSQYPKRRSTAAISRTSVASPRLPQPLLTEMRWFSHFRPHSSGEGPAVRRNPIGEAQLRIHFVDNGN